MVVFTHIQYPRQIFLQPLWKGCRVCVVYLSVIVPDYLPKCSDPFNSHQQFQECGLSCIFTGGFLSFKLLVCEELESHGLSNFIPLTTETILNIIFHVYLPFVFLLLGNTYLCFDIFPTHRYVGVLQEFLIPNPYWFYMLQISLLVLCIFTFVIL